MQRASRRSAIGSSGTSVVRQTSCTRWQRGAKRQPAGSAAGSGGSAGNRRGDLARAAHGREGRQQPLRVRMLGPREHLGRRARLDDLPGVHDRDAVAGLGQHRQVVRDQDQGQAELAAQLLEQLEDLRLHHHVERRGRLVGDHELGLAGQRERDHDALAHAARELVRVLARALRADADVPEQLRDALLDRGLRRLGVVQPDRLADLLVHAHDRIERVHGALEDHRDRAPAQLLHAALGAPVHLDQRPSGDSSVIVPPLRTTFVGSSPSSASAVVVLPQPDSPARPSASPRRTWNETSSTMRISRPSAAL